MSTYATMSRGGRGKGGGSRGDIDLYSLNHAQSVTQKQG